MIVLLGPSYKGHGRIDSKGPIILVGAHSTAPVFSEAWIHVGPLAVPMDIVYGRAGVSVDPESIINNTKIQNRRNNTFPIIKELTEGKYLPQESLRLEGDSSESINKKGDVGGIDLNPELLDIQTSGQGIDFDIPFDPQAIQSIQIDGFSPVIFQIVPTNMPLMLGVSESDQDQLQLTKAQ